MKKNHSDTGILTPYFILLLFDIVSHYYLLSLLFKNIKINSC